MPYACPLHTPKFQFGYQGWGLAARWLCVANGEPVTLFELLVYLLAPEYPSFALGACLLSKAMKQKVNIKTHEGQ